MLSLKTLIWRGKDIDGLTLIMITCNKGQQKVVKLLLDHWNIDSNIRNNVGETIS